MRWLRPSCMLPIETAAHYQTHCWVIFLCCLLSGWHFIWSIQRNQYKWQGSSSWANNYIVLWASWLQWARYWMFWLFWCLPYLDWMNVFCVLIKLSNMIALEQKWVNHCHIDIWVLTLVIHSTGKGGLVIGQSKLQEPFYLFWHGPFINIILIVSYHNRTQLIAYITLTIHEM